MGYIRDNEDYYVSLGYSPERAAVEAEMDRLNIDPGYCNPRKAKEYAEARKEVEERIKSR